MKQKTVQIELPGETPTLSQKEKDLERINPENIETNSRFKADYDKANIISHATFWYGVKFAFKGYFSKNKSGGFDEKDLLTVPLRCRPDVMSDKFTYEMHKRKKEKPMIRLNLVLAVMKTIKWPLIFIFVCETLTAFGRIFSAWYQKSSLRLIWTEMKVTLTCGPESLLPVLFLGVSWITIGIIFLCYIPLWCRMPWLI